MPLPDPFGIRAATAAVMHKTPWVTIDQDAIIRCATTMQETWREPPGWDDTLHFQGTPVETAGWIAVLDVLNFCFWAQGDDPRHRWRVTWRGVTHNGYDALAAALHRAVVDDGYPLWEAGWLREVELDTVAHILRGDEGCPPVPLLTQRARQLNALGSPRHTAQHRPADLAIDAQGSATQVVTLATRRSHAYDDAASWRLPNGQAFPVPFLKRAQILAADLAGALAGTEFAITSHLDQLTAFADYKVPQVLRQLGILHYHPDLVETIHRLERIPPNDPREVSIRAATVQACDQLVLALAGLGITTTANELDGRLWHLGQNLSGATEPYHRTVTSAY